MAKENLTTTQEPIVDPYAVLAKEHGMSPAAFRDELARDFIIKQLAQGKELKYEDIQTACGVSHFQAFGIIQKVSSKIWADSDHAQKLVGHRKPVPGHRNGLKYFSIE